MTILRNRYSMVIFDWDGTLMDSTARIVSSMQTAARQARLPEPSEAQVRSIIGLSMDAVMDRLFPSAEAPLREQLFGLYRHQYVEVDPTPSPLFPGVLPLLDWLRQQEVILAVATGKARAGLSRVMKQAGLDDFFDYSICADESESKPHPQMVLELLAKARCQPENSLVLGDSTHDLIMARQAKVDAIGVTSGACQHDELAVHEPVAILPRVCHLRQWFETALD